ncbi:MAG: peptide-modifying radical SAM enzyme CbpB, partial [Candidatus Brocadiia bacterium]
GEVIQGGELLEEYRDKAEGFAEEMRTLRFGLRPSAVYFNPTERCNLNCSYCYIPERMRRHGEHMSADRMREALRRLKGYFETTVPEDRLPQVVFHGAEPLLNRDAVFEVIEDFHGQFQFGIQTNGVLLDDESVDFLASRGASIGLSLDAASAELCTSTRRTWEGDGVFEDVVEAMERLRGYDGWSVICTISRRNMSQLCELVEFFHEREVPNCLMNIVRCTLPHAMEVKPDGREAARHFTDALDRTRELYEQTGRRLPVANFANILLAIMAPMARRLMCDISPCGGGRCFFAVAPDGGLFPCSEFIGLEHFRGGNLFQDDIEEVLATPEFRRVTERRVEDIDPCNHCAIRHFCGAPCPAEAHEMNGGMDRTGAFCEFYEEQVRYAFRQIADDNHESFLWDDWDRDTEKTFEIV